MAENESQPSPSSAEDGREVKYSRNPYLRALREGIVNKDLVQLRMITDAIQKQVHKQPEVQIASIDDHDLQTLIDTGRGEILVGTGTFGERIKIIDGQLFMREAVDQPGSIRYYNNFRNLFDLTDDQELRVSF